MTRNLASTPSRTNLPAGQEEGLFVKRNGDPPSPPGKLAGTALALGALLGLAIPLLLGAGLAFHSLSDLDIWLHDRAGQQILAGEGLPRENQYSFTAPEHTWVDHEWLFQVLVSLVGSGLDGPEKAGPWNLLRLFLAVILIMILVAGDGSLATTREAGSRRERVLMLALPAVACLALLWTRLILRPELFSYLGFVLAVRWVDRAVRQPADAERTRRGWLSLVWIGNPAGATFWLALIWAQFHGFFVLVALLWLLACLVAPLQRRLTGRGPIVADDPQPQQVDDTLRFRLAAAAFTFAAGLATPNLWAGLAYPFQAVGQLDAEMVNLRETISELAPMLAVRDSLGATVLLFKASLVWSGIWIVATVGRVSLLRLLVWVLAAAAALYSQRNLGFYALAFFLVHSGYRGGPALWWSRLPGAERFRSGPASLIRKLVPWLGLTAAIVWAGIWLGSILDNRFFLAEGVARRYGGGLTPAQYPFAVADSVRRLSRDRPLRIVNNVDGAAVLVNRRAGLVYLDGRTEAYPPGVWREYGELKQGGEGAARILARRRAEAVALAHRNRAGHQFIHTLWEHAGWRLAVADEAGVLFLPVPTDPDSLPLHPHGREILQDAAARLLAESPAFPRAGDVRLADRFLALADLLRLLGLEPTASELYRRGLAHCPTHPTLNHNLGNLLLSQRDFRAALAHFERAVAANGRLVKPRINAGICLFQLGNLVAAESYFLAATRQDSRQPEAWVNLAEVRRRQGDRTCALKAYQRAVALLPHDQRLRQRVTAYQRED